MSKIYGNQKKLDLLKTAYKNDSLASAYIFYGDDGVGKEAVAIELAKIVNGISSDRWMEHPNISYVLPLPTPKNTIKENDIFSAFSNEQIDEIKSEFNKKENNSYYKININKANQIKISQIRYLKKRLSKSSTRGRKFVIISNAEKMTTEASNAFLKSLEEPGENTTLVMITSNLNLLLQTIISRCQKVKFDLLSEDEIKSYINDHYPSVDEPTKELVVSFAQGSISNADKYLNEDVKEIRDFQIDLLRIILKGDNYRSDFLDKTEDFLKNSDKSRMITALKLLQNWLNDCYKLSIGNDDLVNIDDKEAIGKFTMHFGKKSFPEIFKEIDRAVVKINRNVNPQLLFIDLFLKLRVHLLS